VKLFYIGDEASAAGFRLTGACVAVPAPGEERQALAAAREAAALVLVSSSVAARLSARELARAEIALSPLTIVVPDLREDAPPVDLGVRLRSELGLEEPR